MASVDPVTEDAEGGVKAADRIDLTVEPGRDLLVVPAKPDAVLIGWTRTIIRLVHRI